MSTLTLAQERLVTLVGIYIGRSILVAEKLIILSAAIKLLFFM